MPGTAAIDLKTLLDLVGRLDDSEDPQSASQRFRAFLNQNVRSSAVLREYVDACLVTAGEPYNKALQDIVNHIAGLLGFGIEYGRYRGVQGQIGHDGLWQSSSGTFIVVEVKTTDVYTVQTATLLGYINRLVSERRVPEKDSCLGLYVYGRPTAEITSLEKSIVAEKRQNELRVVSVEALLELLELVQDFDLDHATVLDLLLPNRVRVDHLVNLMYGIVAQERAEPVDRAPAAPDVRPDEAAATTNEAKGDPVYFLFPANDSEDGTPVEKNLHRWLDKGMWGIGQRTAFRKEYKAGDIAVFYAAHIRGVVAVAELTTGAFELPPRENLSKLPVPFGIRLKNVRWLKKPVNMGRDLRARLSHFQDRDLDASWAWYVQGTKRVTADDFAILTGQ